MRDYVRGTIVAGAIGDAFGMPCEGLTRAEIARHYGTVTSYRDSLYSRHTKGMKRGEYTDDAQLTLATVESIVEKRTVDIEDIGRRFTDLYKAKQLRAGGRGTKFALKNIVKGSSAFDSGLEDAYGCGAAMRIAPIGLLPLDGRALQLAEFPPLHSAEDHLHVSILQGEEVNRFHELLP